MRYPRHKVGMYVYYILQQCINVPFVTVDIVERHSDTLREQLAADVVYASLQTPFVCHSLVVFMINLPKVNQNIINKKEKAIKKRFFLQYKQVLYVFIAIFY